MKKTVTEVFKYLELKLDFDLNTKETGSIDSVRGVEKQCN